MSNPTNVRRRIQEDNNDSVQLASNLKQKPTNLSELKPPASSEAGIQKTIKCLVFLLAILSILFLFCILIIFLALPSSTYPVSYSLPDRPKLENATSISNFKTSKIFEDFLKGPECILFRNGLMYTGTRDGKVIEADEETQKIRVVAKLGKGDECGSYETEVECGRPLGLEFDADGFLLVADAYLGIFRVDVVTGLVQTVVASSSTKKGLQMNLLDDLKVTDNGEIYFTDASMFLLRDIMLEALQGAQTGRLFKYDPLLNSVTIAASNLAFPNGVLLSQFQDYLLVAETTRARISKYNIRGINAGAMETWVENLPCLPDNLQLSPRGTIWVTCGTPRHQDTFSLIDFFSNMVWLRRILQELPIKLMMYFLKPHSMLLEYTAESGELLRVIVDDNAELLRYSSHVNEKDGKLYVGSYKSDYVAVIEL